MCNIGTFIDETAIIGKNVHIGKNVQINAGVIIKDNVEIGDNSYIDYRDIIRSDVKIGQNSFVGADCILGELLSDSIKNSSSISHPLYIGSNAIIRSGSIIYGETVIGDNFNTGHRVTIREKADIGNNCAIGTLSDIQGYCKIGNHVHMHSNVHIGHESIIEDYVWIFPYTVLTNDPTPPSRPLYGVHVKSFAILSTGTIVLPGVTIENDTLTAGGAIVGKDVEEFSVVGGCPAKKIADVRNIKNKLTGEAVYPWRYHFSEQMPWNEIGFDNWVIDCGDERIINLDKHTKKELEDFIKQKEN